MILGRFRVANQKRPDRQRRFGIRPSRVYGICFSIFPPSETVFFVFSTQKYRFSARWTPRAYLMAELEDTEEVRTSNTVAAEHTRRPCNRRVLPLNMSPGNYRSRWRLSPIQYDIRWYLAIPPHLSKENNIGGGLLYLLTSQFGWLWLYFTPCSILMDRYTSPYQTLTIGVERGSAQPHAGSCLG